MCESLALRININVCVCTRAKPKLSAGCRGLFGLERLHLFDCEHAWEGLGAVKIMTGSERRGRLNTS